MNIREEIKILLIKNGYSLRGMVRKLNEKYNREDSSAKLIRNTIKFREVEEILDILGYELQIHPKAK